MKKILGLILVLLLAASSAFAFAGPAPQQVTTTTVAAPAPAEKTIRAGYPYLIDNFSDGNYNKDPEWFTFDNIRLSVMENSKLSAAGYEVGSKSLLITGSANGWYVGGMGSMLKLPSKNFASFDLDIYGYGEGSGKIKIELYDNDSGKDTIEVDKTYTPVADDQRYYEIDVNWEGWKHFSIPFTQFTLNNPGKGNGVVGPILEKVQVISVAAAEVGSVKYNITNLELGAKK